MAFQISGMEMFTKNMYTENCQAIEVMYNLKKKPTGKEFARTPEVGDNLFVQMRGYLIFGRILGVIPIRGVFSNNHASLNFRFLSLPVIISATISFFVCFTAILAIVDSIEQPKFNTLEIARSVQETIYKVWGLLCYIYFLARANALINIFKTWGRSPLFFNVKDSSLRRDIILITVFLYMCALAEGILLHLDYFPQLDNINGHHRSPNLTLNSNLETYYIRSHLHWKKFLGYHPLLALIAFISHKFVVLCWYYVDLTLIIFSRALYFKFKVLCSVAEETLQNQTESFEVKAFSITDRLSWIYIAKDHETLCQLLDAFEQFLSPLVFGSYATNIYYICMQLIDGLTPDKVDNSSIHSAFTTVSFAVVILRVLLLSVTAARINTYAHDLGNFLKKCPVELYDTEVERVDKHISAGPNLVEIVLLQGLSSTGTSGTCPSTSGSPQ